MAQTSEGLGSWERNSDTSRSRGLSTGYTVQKQGVDMKTGFLGENKTEVRKTDHRWNVSLKERRKSVEDGGSEILGKLDKRAGTMYNLGDSVFL